MAATKTNKVECLNPNTGGRMNIDKDTYDLFAKAIYYTIKKGKALTFTEITKGVNDYLKKHQKEFDGSVGWYAVTVKNDLLARGILKAYTEKGKKLNSIAS